MVVGEEARALVSEARGRPVRGRSEMIDDARFIRNVKESRSNGYDMVCVECGVGMTDDEFEEPGTHDTGCVNEGRDRAAEMSAFLAKRLGAGFLEGGGSSE